MKILLFGSNGQLGSELNYSLKQIGDLKSISKNECNFLNIESIRNVLEKYNPNIIVNAAAYTEVDNCETKKSCFSS